MLTGPLKRLEPKRSVPDREGLAPFEIARFPWPQNREKQGRGGVYQQIELVEVAVHQALGCQAGHQIHALAVHADRALQLPHLHHENLKEPINVSSFIYLARNMMEIFSACFHAISAGRS